MPKGPRGERRPADVIGCAVAVAKLSVGEDVEVTSPVSGRVRSGLAGAKARSLSLTAEQKHQIARKAAQSRWG